MTEPNERSDAAADKHFARRLKKKKIESEEQEDDADTDTDSE